MKEKTFEELFHEALDSVEPYGAFTIPTKKQQAILKLLHQVREATIAEIESIYVDSQWTNEDGIREVNFFYEIKHLPTDRIKTDK